VEFSNSVFAAGNAFRPFLPCSECFLRSDAPLLAQIRRNSISLTLKKGKRGNNTAVCAHYCHLCVGKRKTAIAPTVTSPHHFLCPLLQHIREQRGKPNVITVYNLGDPPVSHGTAISFSKCHIFEKFLYPVAPNDSKYLVVCCILVVRYIASLLRMNGTPSPRFLTHFIFHIICHPSHENNLIVLSL
jgi:hypothetical protein